MILDIDDKYIITEYDNKYDYISMYWSLNIYIISLSTFFIETQYLLTQKHWYSNHFT